MHFFDGTVNLSGGSVGDVVPGTGRVFALDRGTVNVRGGSTRGSLWADDESTVNFSRGSIGRSLEARGTSTVNFSGGSVGYDMLAEGTSTINFSGGSIARATLGAVGSSTIHIFGCDLALSPVAGAWYLLTGRLQDGTVLNHTAYQGEAAQIVLDPRVVAIAVAIDIVPGNARNTIRLNQRVVNVAILSTLAFDATTVDPLTVTFGPGQATELHGRGHIEDVNGDGRFDLLLHFGTEASELTADDRRACLQGSTFGGCAIEGCDAVQVVLRGP